MMRRGIIRLILGVTLFTIGVSLQSCRTPERLVEIAVKRNPNIFKDSVWVKEVNIVGKTVYVSSDGADSLIYEDSLINLKAFCKNNIPSVNFTIKDQLVPVEVPIKTFVPKKTRQEIRLGSKERVIETKIKGKVKEQEVKEGGKTARTELRQEAGLIWKAGVVLLLGIILGVILEIKVLKISKK